MSLTSAVFDRMLIHLFEKFNSREELGKLGSIKVDQTFSSPVIKCQPLKFFAWGVPSEVL